MALERVMTILEGVMTPGPTLITGYYHLLLLHMVYVLLPPFIAVSAVLDSCYFHCPHGGSEGLWVLNQHFIDYY